MKTVNNHSRFLTIVFTLLVALFTFSCENEGLDPQLPHNDPSAAGKPNAEKHGSKTITHYGPAQPIAGGVIRSMVELNLKGEVQSIGIMISERALNQLPHNPTSWVLRLPKHADKTPFDHISFDWNPEGHEPDFIYGLPHFDLHAYTISMEERMQIGPGDPQSPADVNYVAQYMPEGYAPDPGRFTVPMMGMHWINFRSPEFGGSRFNHTFIMGSYDETLIFWEPMFTLEFLKGLSGTVKKDIPPYHAGQVPGLYYPTAYSFTYDPVRKVYIILLDNMEMR